VNYEGEMKERAKRRGSRSVREEHRAPNTTAESRLDVPPPLDTIVWLLQDPAAREGLRRQLIDGTAGAIEPLLHTLAYSGPYEATGNSPRWITTEQMEQQWAAEVAEKRRRPQNEKAAPHSRHAAEKSGA
jgi:hypothetical protein